MKRFAFGNKEKIFAVQIKPRVALLLLPPRHLREPGAFECANESHPGGCSKLGIGRFFHAPGVKTWGNGLKL